MWEASDKKLGISCAVKLVRIFLSLYSLKVISAKSYEAEVDVFCSLHSLSDSGIISLLMESRQKLTANARPWKTHK